MSLFWSLAAACAAIGVGALVVRLRRPRHGGGRPVTAYGCMQELERLGWVSTGAGPNYWCMYGHKGKHRIVLLSTIADPVTEAAVQDLVAGLRQAEHTEGRRAVAAYGGALGFGVAESGAAQDVTLVHASALAGLEAALDATEAAADAHRAAEIRALTRAYDAPEPAPMQAGNNAAQGGPILETQRVACFFRDRGGDDLLITFSNQWLRYDGRAFWADSASAALGLSVVGFVAKEPCWYPADDMAALVPAVLERLGGRFANRILYGHSQGGFAAIKFSTALGARTVLAFSPQFSIDQRIVRDDRVNRYYVGHNNAGMAIAQADCAGDIFVFFDPFDAADARHAAAIGDAAIVIPVELNFAGHATERGLTDAARLRGLLDASRGGADALRPFMARQRGVRAERAVLMAMTLAERRPRTAAAILNHYAGRWKPDQISNVSYRLAKAGQAALAIGPACEAAQSAPGNAHAQGTAALIALELRQLDIAQTLLARAQELEPHSEKWRDAAQRIRGLATAQ